LWYLGCGLVIGSDRSLEVMSISAKGRGEKMALRNLYALACLFAVSKVVEPEVRFTKESVHARTAPRSP
jgi:hypothetical protein